ncbi:hypothetical protein ACFRFU_19890 [Streptomyces sp. NPDC056704]|uniref:hypothetical protein n=1 Tax=Streptomyces sp. NPDC056704 TaxID=3345917 RepID=UPI003679FFE8
MTTYKGAALLLIDDGRQFTGEADLSKDASGTWCGVLAFAGEEHVPALLNVREGRVRIDGRDGAFVRPDISDWAASPRGPFRMRIEGNGDAPF